MQTVLNKAYMTLIGVLLSIIGFFLIATYQKINETNVMVYQLQIELAAIRANERTFMTYSATAALIDKKISQYHKDGIFKSE